MKRAMGIVAVAAVLSTAGIAFAGLKTNAEVTVDTKNRTVFGDLGSTRNSSNNVEFISVSIEETATGAKQGVSSVTFTAEDKNGHFGSCTSTAPNIVAVAKAMGTDGRIQFNWDANGDCTLVDVILASFSPPKKS